MTHTPDFDGLRNALNQALNALETLQNDTEFGIFTETETMERYHRLGLDTLTAVYPFVVDSAKILLDE